MNPSPDKSWEIITTVKPYTPGRGELQLRIKEKMQINAQAGKKCLNKLVKLIVNKQDLNWPTWLDLQHQNTDLKWESIHDNTVSS